LLDKFSNEIGGGRGPLKARRGALMGTFAFPGSSTGPFLEPNHPHGYTFVDPTMMRRSPLYDRHKAHGARFVDFGGWEMPVQYSGIIDEHNAVRQRAGLFDVSHMGEIELRGPQAIAAAQELTVNDVGRLKDGEAQYSLFCLPTGGVVDDVMVHRMSAERILICVNAANIEKDLQWMRDHAGGAEVIDRSEEVGLLALQGPQATTILEKLTPLHLGELRRFSFAEAKVADRRALVAHTGYTGEDGWELYCDSADVAALWDAILEAGAPAGIMPAGLGARDTLRLESALPLYGHELDENTTPLEARLSWVVRLSKKSFIGREALVKQKERGLTRQLVGFSLVGRGIARQGYALLHGPDNAGIVTSGTMSPTLGKAIGLGYVAPKYAGLGASLNVDVRGRQVAAEIVRLPFYKREA
jgi:aminomethyltransferase